MSTYHRNDKNLSTYNGYEQIQVNINEYNKHKLVLKIWKISPHISKYEQI
jgi:hypothetical protein